MNKQGGIVFRKGKYKLRKINRKKSLLSKKRIKLTSWGSLQNGGFEDATPLQAAHWSVSSNDIYFAKNDSALFGKGYAVIALTKGEDAVLSQITLPLEDSNYRLAFWLRRVTTPMDGTITVSLIGSSLLPITYQASLVSYLKWRKFIITINSAALDPGKSHTLSVRFSCNSSSLLLNMDNVTLFPT
ncbi:hypothetical protein [Paenibacillus solanacearum]|nr:hypothetical protein [Paenibacillus solanacearum]